MKKICTNCQEEKEEGNFGTRKTSKGERKLLPRCKECMKKYLKAYQSKPEVKEKMRESTKKYQSKPENKKKLSEAVMRYQSKPENKKKMYMAIKKYQQSDKGKAYLKEYQQSDKSKATVRKYQQSEKGKEVVRKAVTKRRAKDPKSFMYLSIKNSSKKRGMELLSREEFYSEIGALPVTCPLLGIELSYDGKRQPNTASVDRIDSSKGYVKGNLWIVSLRANIIKSDATLEELEMMVDKIKSLSQ